MIVFVDTEIVLGKAADENPVRVGYVDRKNHQFGSHRYWLLQANSIGLSKSKPRIQKIAKREGQNQQGEYNLGAV